MNRVMTLGLALPALFASSSALAGEPPFPAPREVIVVDEDDIDEEALREELREEIRREIEEQLEAERDMEDDVVVLPPADDVVVVDTTTPIMEEEYRHNISAGAGAFGFIADDLDFQDAVGPAWSVRYGLNLPILRNVARSRFVTWEVSYTGATDTDDGDVVMTATMLETGLKVNPLGPFMDTVVYPIITAGIGYGAFTRDVGPADLEDLGTLTLPLAAGVEVALDNFLINGRATYRPVFFDEDELLFTDVGMDNWTIHGEIGTRF